jgi:hypothetical protein
LWLHFRPVEKLINNEVINKEKEDSLSHLWRRRKKKLDNCVWSANFWFLMYIIFCKMWVWSDMSRWIISSRLQFKYAFPVLQQDPQTFIRDAPYLK